VKAGDEELALQRGMAICKQIQYTTSETVMQCQDDKPPDCQQGKATALSQAGCMCGDLQK